MRLPLTVLALLLRDKLELQLVKGLAFRDRLGVIPMVKVGFQESWEMPVWELRRTERCTRR